MEVERRIVPGAADMAIEVVADLLGSTAAEDVAGYIVVGLMKPNFPSRVSREDRQQRLPGFKIASNAKDDDSEIFILERLLVELKRARES